MYYKQQTKPKRGWAGILIHPFKGNGNRENPPDHWKGGLGCGQAASLTLNTPALPSANTDIYPPQKAELIS